MQCSKYIDNRMISTICYLKASMCVGNMIVDVRSAINRHHFPNKVSFRNFRFVNYSSNGLSPCLETVHCPSAAETLEPPRSGSEWRLGAPWTAPRPWGSRRAPPPTFTHPAPRAPSGGPASTGQCTRDRSENSQRASRPDARAHPTEPSKRPASSLQRPSRPSR